MYIHMKGPNRILFISQEINPYLVEETPVRLLNRQLPEYFQSHGYETRTFMPKFGEINERRNQLHEVIRLSGMNGSSAAYQSGIYSIGTYPDLFHR